MYMKANESLGGRALKRAWKASDKPARPPDNEPPMCARDIIRCKLRWNAHRKDEHSKPIARLPWFVCLLLREGLSPSGIQSAVERAHMPFSPPRDGCCGASGANVHKV